MVFTEPHFISKPHSVTSMDISPVEPLLAVTGLTTDAGAFLKIFNLDSGLEQHDLSPSLVHQGLVSVLGVVWANKSTVWIAAKDSRGKASLIAVDIVSASTTVVDASIHLASHQNDLTRSYDGRYIGLQSSRFVIWETESCDRVFESPQAESPNVVLGSLSSAPRHVWLGNHKPYRVEGFDIVSGELLQALEIPCPAIRQIYCTPIYIAVVASTRKGVHVYDREKDMWIDNMFAGARKGTYPVVIIGDVLLQPTQTLLKGYGLAEKITLRSPAIDFHYRPELAASNEVACIVFTTSDEQFGWTQLAYSAT